MHSLNSKKRKSIKSTRSLVMHNNDRCKQQTDKDDPIRTHSFVPSSNNKIPMACNDSGHKKTFSKFHYQQIGAFLTQYKIRETFKFVQMFAVPPMDPNGPRPEGGTSVPACGEPLLVPHSFPQSLEGAIHKFANSSSKSVCITILDENGKVVAALTYG
jgi:hypothetical protein